MSDDFFRTRHSLLSRLRHPSRTKEWNEAWDQFFEKYAPLIYHWCKRRGLDSSTCDDACQKVLLKLNAYLKKYDKERTFRSWLNKIVNNVLNDVMRADAKQHSAIAIYAQLVSEAAKDELCNLLAGERDRELFEVAARVVQEALRATPLKWKAFELKEIEHKTGKEAAAALEISLKSVLRYRDEVNGLLKKEIATLQEQDDAP